MTTTAGAIATKDASLTVVADNLLTSYVNPSRIKAGERMAVHGRFLLAPGTKPGDTAASGTETVGGLIGEIRDDATQSIRWPLTFTGHYTDDAVQVQVGQLQGGTPVPTADTPATMTLDRAGGQSKQPVIVAPS